MLVKPQGSASSLELISGSMLVFGGVRERRSSWFDIPSPTSFMTLKIDMQKYAILYILRYAISAMLKSGEIHKKWKKHVKVLFQHQHDTRWSVKYQQKTPQTSSFYPPHDRKVVPKVQGTQSVVGPCALGTPNKKLVPRKICTKRSTRPMQLFFSFDKESWKLETSAVCLFFCYGIFC